MSELVWNPSKRTEGNWITSKTIKENGIGGREQWTFVVFKSPYREEWKIRATRHLVNRVFEEMEKYEEQVSSATFDNCDEAKAAVEAIAEEIVTEVIVEKEQSLAEQQKALHKARLQGNREFLDK